MEIYIAGAHSRARTMGYYLKYLDSSTEILAYLYNNDEENPIEIDGVPVIKINENSKLNIECPVYLATRKVNHTLLLNTLIKCGMKNIIPVDVQLDLNIRNRYLKKYFKSLGREYIKLEQLDIQNGMELIDDRTARIYVAGSIYDKSLQSPYKYEKYEKLIQLGAALSSERLDTDCRDNSGDNISEKNTQFCELTGIYWLWKNAEEDIIGLAHYRRHFLIPNDWKERMIHYNIDVILPVPLYVAPNIESNYKFRHISQNWDYMLEYLKENDLEDYDKALTFFRSMNLYIPCNMFIMRRQVLHDLCSWLFPILFAVSEKGGILKDAYQNRYPGFLSERLITYFFEKNRRKYKIVYADKNFLY